MKLILLPGMDGTGVLFEPILEALPSWIQPQVVCYPNDAALGYRELLPLVRDALPASGDYVILGESFSGPLALMCAASPPAGLRGIILCGSFVRNPAPGWFTVLAQPLLFRLTPMTLVCWQVLGRYRNERLKKLLVAATAKISAHVLAARAREIARVDVAAALTRCPVDVLLMTARDDWLVGRKSVAEMLEARPSARHIELAGPHLLLQTLPRESAEAISAFITSLMPPSEKL